MTRPPVEAVILDMDGLLIATEPAWRAAGSAVFAGPGISLSERDLLDSTGQPIEELIPLWRRRQRPPEDRDRSPGRAGAGPTDAEVVDRITGQVIAHVMAKGQPMPGVTAAIALFERYGLPLAIASSSPLRLITPSARGWAWPASRCAARPRTRRWASQRPTSISRRHAGSGSRRRGAWRWKTPRTGSRRRCQPACAAWPSRTRCSPPICASARPTWSSRR